MSAENRAEKDGNKDGEFSKEKTAELCHDSEELEVDLYKIDPEKEKQIMKELEDLEEKKEELEDSDSDEKEDNVYA